jgi:hypothetical protein
MSSPPNPTFVLPERIGRGSRQGAPVAVVLWPSHGGFGMRAIDARVARAHCMLHGGGTRAVPRQRRPRG